MIQFPETKYVTQGDLANAANVGMTTLDALFNGYQQHDESELRNLSLKDAAELLKQRQLDTVPKQYEAKLAQAKMDDSRYIPSSLEGYIAQNDLQRMAAKKSLALTDDQIKGEKQNLLMNFRRNDMIGQIQQLDDQITTEPNPKRRAQLSQLRNTITDQLKNTPEFSGKRELNDDDNWTKLEIERMRLRALQDREEFKLSQKTDLPTMSKLEAMYRKRYAANPNDYEAQSFLDELEGFRKRTNPMMNTQRVDIPGVTQGQIPVTTPAQQAGGRVPPVPAGDGSVRQQAILAEIARRQKK